MNDLLARLIVLRHIINEGGKTLPWCGDLALQKLVYLLQNVYGAHLGYEYGLHHLGPYSYDLAGDLSLGANAGLWEVKPRSYSTGNGGFTVNQYAVTDFDPSFFPGEVRHHAEEAWRDVCQSVKDMARVVSGMTGRQLELIATIHYLRTVQGVPEDDLWDVLHALKPKYSFTEFEQGLQHLVSMQTVLAAPA